MKLAKKYDVYISEYVLLELQENYVEDHGIIITPEQLSDFVNMIGMKAIQSGPIQPDISWMVGDVDDLQILQDAVVVSADVLITKNIQDFDVGSIYEYLHIQVVDSIPYELLIGL